MNPQTICLINNVCHLFIFFHKEEFEPFLRAILRGELNKKLKF